MIQGRTTEEERDTNVGVAVLRWTARGPERLCYLTRDDAANDAFFLEIKKKVAKYVKVCFQ